MVPGINVFDHEGRQFVLPVAGAAIQEYSAVLLEQALKFLNDALVIWKMLYHYHDHNRIEFYLRVIGEEIREYDLPVIAQLLGAFIEELLGGPRDRDARAFDPTRRGILEPCTPPRPDFKN